MKEKSNASALTRDETQPNLGRETTESGTRGADKWRERSAEDYLTLQR